MVDYGAMRAIFLLLLPLLVSCNIYSPFAPSSSTEDLVEEGRKCEHDGDFGCAIDAYSKIPDPLTKHEKLCQGYLAQGGVTLSVLINTLTQGTSKILGDVATALMPWSSDKGTALLNAKNACIEFANLATTTIGRKQSALLKSLSLIADCSIRISKTDEFVATSNSDESCTTPGTRDGRITQSDVAENSTGVITTVGMCASDVTACDQNIAAIDGTGLSNAGLTQIKAGVDAIPAGLGDGGATNVVRGAIRESVQ